MPRLLVPGGRAAALLTTAGLLLLVLGPAAGVVGAKVNPDIWLTATPCATSDSTGIGEFSPGQHVVIRGIAFDGDTVLDYEIKGQPGNASADPDTVVASGTVTTDDVGAFCVDAYTVLGDDDGSYKVSVDSKQDMYSVAAGSPAPSGSVAPSGSPSYAPSDSPSSAPSGSPVTSAGPSGGAGGETASASLPPTDRVSGGASGDALGLVLMVLAGILAAAMVLTPARVARR